MRQCYEIRVVKLGRKRAGLGWLRDREAEEGRSEAYGADEGDCRRGHFLSLPENGVVPMLWSIGGPVADRVAKTAACVDRTEDLDRVVTDI